MSYRHKHIKPKLKRFKPKKSIVKMPLFWILLGFSIVLVIGIYFGFFYAKLQVSNVEVSGNEQLLADDVKATVFDIINKKVLFLSMKNIAFINTSSIEKTLLQVFPRMYFAKVTRDFPNTVMVSLKERQAVANICTKNQEDCYLVDNEGIVFEKISSFNPVFMNIYEQTIDQAQLGSALINKDTLTSLLVLEDKLQEDFSLKIASVTITDLLLVTTSEGWVAYFDYHQNMDLQISKLKTLLAGQITPEARRNLSYIYLQYKDRAYYK